MVLSGKFRKALAAAILMAVGLILSLAVVQLFGLIGDKGDSSQGFTLGQLTPCEEQQPGEVALLGRLAPGRSVAELRARGYRTTAAVDGIEDDLVVIRGVSGAQFSALQSEPALRAVGPLLAQSSDPDLRSCDYRLSDKPKAAALAEVVGKAMVDAGLLTRAQIDAGGTIFTLSDDPTNPRQLFFTVILARPVPMPSPIWVPLDNQPATGPRTFLNIAPQEELDRLRDATQASGYLDAYVAVIDKTTGDVVGVGRAHWYD